MSYLLVEDFRGGVDSRRSRFTLPAGTLYRGQNVHLTRGGELEIRKAFVSKYNLAGLGTVGLYADAGGLLTFGSMADPGVPSGIEYQRLQDPDGGTLTRIRDATLFNGKAYVIAEYSNENVNVFYDGQVIAAFYEGMVRGRDATDMRNYFQTLFNAHELVTDLGFSVAAFSSYQLDITGPESESFTLTGRSINTDTGASTTFDEDSGTGGDIEIALLQTAGQPIAAVAATARFQVTGTGGAGSGVTDIDAGGSPNLLNATVAWAGTVSDTAAAIVSSINAATSTTGYSATNVDNVVTISAPDADGDSANGRVLTITTDANVAITKLSNFDGGVDETVATAKIYRVTIKSTIESNKALSLFVEYDGDDYRLGAQQIAGVKPTACATLKGKVYLTASTLCFFSALNDPTDYEDALETAGFINMANEFSGADELTGIGVYQNNLAVFARRQAFIYFVDADPGLNRQLQVLNNTGALAEGSIVSVGDLDLLYLSDTGVRSLRARDSSNYAAVSDVGNPIDENIVEDIRTLGDSEAALAAAIIEPVDGRYLMAIGGKIYNFTNFPSSKIAAWTDYVTDFEPQTFASLANRVYVRGDDDVVYLYGGDDNDQYEEMDVVVILPHMDAKSPALKKKFTGFDMTAEGIWTVYMSTNTQEPDRYEKIGTHTTPTYDLGRWAIASHGTHVSIKLTNQGGEYGRIGNMAIHYKGDEAD